MALSTKPTANARSTLTGARVGATIEPEHVGNVALIRVGGVVDETFLGFGTLPANVRGVVLDVSTMARMTSFGVRQWMKAMDALPRSADVYVLGCPTFFVDQLNMVLNFCAAAKVLSVEAPYSCPSCGVESGEIVDVLADRALLLRGEPSRRECARCGGALELDEMADSYFSFVTKLGASTVNAEVAGVLAARGRLSAPVIAAEKPPRLLKLVHGVVTYFRIIGVIGERFRARAILVGTEGEVVIDLADVSSFDRAGHGEWQRLLKTMSATVPAITLVDMSEQVLQVASDTLTLARNIHVASVYLPYTCIECRHVTHHSVPLAAGNVPASTSVCATCGGPSRYEMTHQMNALLRHASTFVPQASAQLIARRDELVSRALTNAKVAEAGDKAVREAADGAILGKYKIVRRLSAGGMAEVFLANQTGLGGFEKIVALKRIQRQLLDNRHLAIDLFLNEAKIAGRLVHPNLVQVLDVGEVAGALYLAMEYVHGKDLRDVAKQLSRSRTKMPLGDACYIIGEIAQALHYAYWSTDLNGNRMSVVHRDVSPHNVILSFDGAVKLLDFGVAMSAVTDHAQKLIAGKWTYMAPEAIENKQMDHRSDLFSLGVILYLLCAGAMPFYGRDRNEIMPMIRGGHYKRLEAPDVPPQLAALVASMLAANPDERPQTGQAVATELADIARTHGLVASSATVETLLATLFPEETTARPSLVDLQKHMFDERKTRRIAVGSGPTQAQEHADAAPLGTLPPTMLEPGSRTGTDTATVIDPSLPDDRTVFAPPPTFAFEDAPENISLRPRMPYLVFFALVVGLGLALGFFLVR